MWRYDKENGLILLCVLVFMQLFAMIGIYVWQNVLLSQKESQLVIQRDDMFYRTDLYLSSLEQSLLSEKAINSPCLLSENEVIDFTMGSESWWQVHACQVSDEGVRYFYVIENLGISHCSIILPYDKKDDQVLAAFYRITLRSISDKMPNAMLLLQATLAKRSMVHDAAHAECHRSEYFLTEGQQAWRFLN